MACLRPRAPDVVLAREMRGRVPWRLRAHLCRTANEAGITPPEGNRSRHDRACPRQHRPRGSDQPGPRSRVPVLISSRTDGAVILAEDR
jgi:hypothetical protein